LAAVADVAVWLVAGESSWYSYLIRVLLLLGLWYLSSCHVGRCCSFASQVKVEVGGSAVDRTDRSFVLTARYVLRNCICENDEAGAKISP